MSPRQLARPARLALADGTVYRGAAFGAVTMGVGEVCFNTSITGYQEILTDPSYAGQIVAMTYPQIGNIGTNPEDEESRRPFLSGFVVKELFEPSNWRSREPLDAYLRRHGVPGISDIDTRALVRRLRDGGFQVGVISTDPARQDEAELVAIARGDAGLEGRDLAAEVTCDAAYRWSEGRWTGIAGQVPRPTRPGTMRRLVAYDFGIKWNILRRLVTYGCEVSVFPASTPAKDVLASGVDGIFLSNGPGDPAAVGYAIENTRDLTKADKPIFGICLGHQILGLALGGKTFKLKFGHRGANHPVKFLETGKVEITSQNHGFAVDPESLPSDVKVTHLNLYDGTVEGLRVLDRPIYSVQYHPEASPGPHDADYLFKQFVDDMEKRR